VRASVISPGLLEELANDNGKLERKLDSNNLTQTMSKFSENEASFRLSHASNAMANEKLAQGIRGFVGDTDKLISYLKKI